MSTSTMEFPFSLDGQPFTNSQTHSVPATQVESLTLPELMKNPHVQTMYNNWKDASAQIVQGAQMQHKLWTENNRLNAEIQTLQERHQQTLTQVQDSLTYLHSPSIAPSDSISHNGSGSHTS
ncbi:hypothetical protein PILCRDRAFT_12690 [Piloderma croceum F 1598]|uniref:Uncharacterized protein n=1 Tax=Piloderma croceum (strain F 1598) TaxID=765440 RepID=A0A0C3ARV6_PILCF|nr:hypothetical protein PILCRDRAFT_12690 [Piloderma croceum F 1598]